MHGESTLALEDLLDNLYEVQFPLGEEGLALAQTPINYVNCLIVSHEWAFIEELL